MILDKCFAPWYRLPTFRFRGKKKEGAWKAWKRRTICSWNVSRMVRFGYASTIVVLVKSEVSCLRIKTLVSVSHTSRGGDAGVGSVTSSHEALCSDQCVEKISSTRTGVTTRFFYARTIPMSVCMRFLHFARACTSKCVSARRHTVRSGRNDEGI